jgi:hypothetical protein
MLFCDRVLTDIAEGDLYMWGRGFLKSFWFMFDQEGDETQPAVCKYFKDWIVKDIAFGDKHALIVCKLVYVADEQ